MRAKDAEPPPLEAPPDVKRLVGAKLDSVFTAASRPTHVQVSQPLHDPRGLGWTACVRAELTSVTGTPLGTRTYRISINEGVIFDRRHVEADDRADGLSATVMPRQRPVPAAQRNDAALPANSDRDRAGRNARRSGSEKAREQPRLRLFHDNFDSL